MNPIFSRKKIVTAFVGLMLFTACDNYGKKLTFNDTKGEVFYKSEGVTEADANAVGRLLEDQQFFLKDDKKRSVQLVKNNNRIEARFVIDEKVLATIPNADNAFSSIGDLMSKTIFNNTPVDIIYTDDTFKDKKTVSFKTTPEVPASKKEAVNESAHNISYSNEEQSFEEQTINEEIAKMNRKDYKENTLYCGDRITDEEATKLAEYLKKAGFFTETSNNDLIVNKLNDKDAYFRFSIKASANNDESLQLIDNFVKQLKADFFEKESLRFEVLDEHMRHIKTFSY